MKYYISRMMNVPWYITGFNHNHGHPEWVHSKVGAKMYFSLSEALFALKSTQHYCPDAFLIGEER